MVVEEWDSCSSDNWQCACSLGKYLNVSKNFTFIVLVFHWPYVFNQPVRMVALTGETMLRSTLTLKTLN